MSLRGDFAFGPFGNSGTVKTLITFRDVLNAFCIMRYTSFESQRQNMVFGLKIFLQYYFIQSKTFYHKCSCNEHVQSFRKRKAKEIN